MVGRLSLANLTVGNFERDGCLFFHFSCITCKVYIYDFFRATGWRYQNRFFIIFLSFFYHLPLSYFYHVFIIILSHPFSGLMRA